MSQRCQKADVLIAGEPASCRVPAGHVGKCDLRLDVGDAAAEIARLEAALRDAERALGPFASGNDWGTVKAWIVEGARTLGKVGDGLDAAQRITRWQVAVDAALHAHPEAR